MANASKNKGKSFERDIAKHLSGVTGLNFERVPNSGAFVGGANFGRFSKLTTEQAGMFEGDIITPKEWNHIRLECKWYKDFRWHQLFDPDGEDNLNKWIHQAKQGSRPYWFLCFRINRAGEFVVFSEALSKLLKMPLNVMTYSSVLPENGSGVECFKIVSMCMFFEFNKDVILKLGEKNDSNNGNEQTE